MKIVYLGDVVGRSGRDAVLENIENIRAKYRPDVFVVNVENSAHGFGATPKICDEFLKKGVDVMVTGNNVWKQKELMPYLDECKFILRPLNYPSKLPGRGMVEFETLKGKKILVVQFMGKLLMEETESFMVAAENMLKEYTLGQNVDAIFVDMHAEVTAEKLAFAHWLDGKVSVVAGTHTHVPTSDARVLDNGTAYISDVGMCGDYNSVIGFDKQEPIKRLFNQNTGGKLQVANGKGTVFGIFVETDDKSGLAKNIEQFKF